MHHQCVFLTLDDPTGFTRNDHLLVEPLARFGWKVQEIPWTRDGVDWSEFDVVVIRSTWDYQKTPERFLNTLQVISDQTRLLNPLNICRWNIHKRYLQDLQNKGVTIVPTDWLPQLCLDSIKSAFEAFQSDRLVAKPLIGAGANDTFVLQAEHSETWDDALQVYASGEVMIQPFLSSILAEGEYSLFYFGGQLSHAIIKRPAAGDFRVQEEHGGLIQPVEPADDLVQVAEQVLNAIDQTLLYARVDLVRLTSGEPALIELELIEPSLYFEQDDSAADRFAEQFQRMIPE